MQYYIELSMPMCIMSSGGNLAVSKAVLVGLELECIDEQLCCLAPVHETGRNGFGCQDGIPMES